MLVVLPVKVKHTILVKLPEYFGSHAKYGSREYDPDQIGIPIEKRSIKSVKINAEGVQRVEAHLARFKGEDPAVDEMRRRLHEIAAGRLKATKYDKQFYAHELREFERYEALGWKHGEPEDIEGAYNLWNNAHTATLKEYNVMDELVELFHPDARKKWNDSIKGA